MSVRLFFVALKGGYYEEFFVFITVFEKQLYADLNNNFMNECH